MACSGVSRWRADMRKRWTLLVACAVSHPSSPDVMYAPAGGGLYRSLNGRVEWELLYNCYYRAAWIDPSNPDHIILGPADGVDHRGRIEQTMDGGRTWSLASTGLDIPWARYMVKRFYQHGNKLFAILSNGDLIVASVHELFWRKVVSEIKRVTAITLMEM